MNSSGSIYIKGNFNHYILLFHELSHKKCYFKYKFVQNAGTVYTVQYILYSDTNFIHTLKKITSVHLWVYIVISCQMRYNENCTSFPYCKWNTFYLWGKMLLSTDDIKMRQAIWTKNQTMPSRQEQTGFAQKPGKRGSVICRI